MRTGPHHSGFTIFFRPDHPPTFCQRLGAGHNPMHLRLFEEVGTDGLANKVWNRLFPDVTLACSELRVVQFIRPMTVSNVDPYMEEFRDCEILSEKPPDPNYEGTMDIISEVTVACAEVIRRDVTKRVSQ